MTDESGSSPANPRGLKPAARDDLSGTAFTFAAGYKRSAKIATGLLVYGISLFSPLALGQESSRLKEALRSALAAVPHARTVTGVCILETTSGKTVLAHHADEPMIPASNMKVFAMAVALSELGVDFAFETLLATDGVNLYLIGDGDPALGDARLYRKRGERITADFERWADALVQRGVHAVPGDIIIDDTIFDTERVHPSWDKADLDNWYAAPVGGLNFNDNCLDITITRRQKPGSLVRVSVQPENALAKITNRCRSGGRGKPVLQHAFDTWKYKIKGHCSKDKWPFGPVSVPDPGLLTADSLRMVFSKKGVWVAGTIRRERVRQADGTLPDSLLIIGRHRSPMTDVLRRTGKNSQNLFAECLLKRAGRAWAARNGARNPQGSWALGSQAVFDVVQRAGINTTGLVVADGSGLSRDNRCTARQLAAVLAWMRTQPGGSLFYDSLSVSGVDGSLRKRLKDAPGIVRGKTGTMRGVRTLSGYVDGEDGQRYAIAVLFNGYKGPSTPYREIQDRICRILARK